MNIFVGSLPWSLEEADLRESFEAYGAVESVKIITDKFTGRSKGFGFVEMTNDEEGQKATTTVAQVVVVVTVVETIVVVEMTVEVTETMTVVETEEDTKSRLIFKNILNHLKRGGFFLLITKIDKLHDKMYF